jgi:hypothetical protein
MVVAMVVATAASAATVGVAMAATAAMAVATAVATAVAAVRLRLPPRPRLLLRLRLLRPPVPNQSDEPWLVRVDLCGVGGKFDELIRATRQDSARTSHGDQSRISFEIRLFLSQRLFSSRRSFRPSRADGLPIKPSVRSGR